MYNKHQFKKTNDKKILRKIGKSWKVISFSLLMAIGGAAIATHANANAANVNTANSNNHTEANINTNQMSANHTILVKSQSVSTNSNASQSASNYITSSNVAQSANSVSTNNINSNSISFETDDIANHIVGNTFNVSNTSSAYSLASSYADDLFNINYDYISVGLDSVLPEDENILGDTVNTGWALESGESSLSIDKLNSIGNEYSNAVSKVTNDVTNMSPSWKYNKVNGYYNMTKSANSNIQSAYSNLNVGSYMNTPTDGGIMNVTRSMLTTGYLRSCVKNDLHTSPITLNDMVNASTFADEASNTAASADAIINSDKASYSSSMANRSSSNSTALALASAYSRNYNSMYSVYAHINNDTKITNRYLHEFGISAVTEFQSEISPQFNNSMKSLSSYHTASQMTSYAISVDAEYTRLASQVLSSANSLANESESMFYNNIYSDYANAKYDAYMDSSCMNNHVNQNRNYGVGSLVEFDTTRAYNDAFALHSMLIDGSTTMSNAMCIAPRYLSDANSATSETNSLTYSASVSASYNSSYASSVNASYAASYSASVDSINSDFMSYNPINASTISETKDVAEPVVSDANNLYGKSNAISVSANHSANYNASLFR